jgi:hypothetical protein
MRAISGTQKPEDGLLISTLIAKLANSIITTFPKSHGFTSYN